MARPPAFQAKAIQSLKEGIEKEQYTVRMLQAPKQKMFRRMDFWWMFVRFSKSLMMVFFEPNHGRKQKNGGSWGDTPSKEKGSRVVE